MFHKIIKVLLRSIILLIQLQKFLLLNFNNLLQNYKKVRRNLSMSNSNEFISKLKNQKKT